MATVVETRPQPRRGLGCCLGKGCLILVVLFLVLAAVFLVGGYVGTRHAYTSTKPREFPAVETSPAQQQAVLQRWDNFQAEVEAHPTPLPATSATPETAAATPTPTPARPTIEFSAGDINQLIAANRKARGHAFVTIAGGVGHVAVSVPLDKLGFQHRYFNADFEVRAAPDGNPNGIQLTTESSTGLQVPGRVLNFLLGMGTVRSYVDPYVHEYQSDYHVSTFRIVGDHVVIEASPPR